MGVPLWRDLPAEKQRAHSNRFLKFAPIEIDGLPDDEFYLFAQWIYGREYRQMATKCAACNGGADFVYDFVGGAREFLRVYPNSRVPVAFIADILETVKNEKYSKIRVYMRVGKTESAKKMSSAFPLVFEVVGIEELRRRLADEQRRAQKAKFDREMQSVAAKSGDGNRPSSLLGKIKSVLLRKA